jgi:hypothetical protein
MVTTRRDSAVRRIVRATPALIAAAMLTSCGGGGGDVDAELILGGGLIWYGPGAPGAVGDTPTSIAIANGKVLAVGDDAELVAYLGPATRRIDLPDVA